MSMPVPQGKAEVGETVASFPAYEGAQKAVSALITGDVPARDIAIVGRGLRSIERVTGRLGYATAARSGALNGLLLGLFFSAIFLLGSPSVQVAVFIGVLFVGVALGMLMSIGAYAIVRRRRDFASVMQVVADHYDVTVLPASIHRAREILGPMTTVARPPASETTSTTGGEPPRYGERAVPPAYGERIAPPRYGERIPERPADDAPRTDEADAPAGGTDAAAEESGDPDGPPREPRGDDDAHR